MGSTRGSRETERAAVTRNSRIVGPLVCLAILGERKYPVLKSSFAYCASRRRVFGSANNGGLPLSTSLFLLSLSLSPSASSSTAWFSRRTRVLDHAHASRSIIPERRFLEARARARNRRDPTIPGERAGRSSSITHVGPRRSFPRSPRAFPRSFTRFPFI